MQIPEESQINFSEEDRYRLNVINSSIEELLRVIVVIQNGIAEEMVKVKSAITMMDHHALVLKEIQQQQVVSIIEIDKMRQDHRSYVKFLEVCRDTLNSLNKVLKERLDQLEVLIKKRRAILEKYRPAQVFYFKKHE